MQIYRQVMQGSILQTQQWQHFAELWKFVRIAFPNGLRSERQYKSCILVGEECSGMHNDARHDEEIELIQWFYYISVNMENQFRNI